MNIVFFGTPQLSVPYLEALCAAGHQLVAVVTQPDRPGRRGRQPVAGPIKVAAQKRRLPLLQPERVGEAAPHLEEVQTDVGVVVAYGQILTAAVRECPRLGCLNVHYSLLPKLRGAAPVQRALIQGLATTGITIQRMSSALDAGNILLQEAVRIEPDDDQQTLCERLTLAGTKLALTALEPLAAGKLKGCPQDPAEATWAPRLTKAECAIDWSLPAQQVRALIHGCSPSPGAHTIFRGRRLRLLRARVWPFATAPGGAAGQLVEMPQQKLGVLCGAGAVELFGVQPEGRRVMTGPEFVRGARLGPREQFS